VQQFFREIYYGETPRAVRTRLVVLAFDVCIVVYFVVATFLPVYPWMLILDRVLGVLLAIDVFGRLAASYDPVHALLEPLTVIDLVIVVSLLVPVTTAHLTFMRVVRALRLVRSYSVVRRLRRRSRFFARNEEVIVSALNLLIFIFVVTAVVFVMQADINPGIDNYIDALYFTITTLTTTGFGDITLIGSAGRLLAVVIMIVGVALFLRLVQAIFRPLHVQYECPACGLTRHDLDAVHCKHCGGPLHIKHEGLGD
jgi:voltage-gated potassium channel